MKKRSLPKSLGIVVIGLWIGVGLGMVFLLVASTSGMIDLDIGEVLGSGGVLIAPEENSPAPDFELENLAGRRVRLADLQGHVVVLNFWATWCGPCVREIPMFQEYHEQYAPHLVVLGINEEETNQVVAEFVEQSDMDYEVLLDLHGSVATLYKVVGLPLTIFIDEQGVLRYRHIGILSEQQLSSYMHALGVVE